MEQLDKEMYFNTLDELAEKYPDYCEAEDVDCLNLVMRKEFAEEILTGKKTVEYRTFSNHYTSRLFDKKVLQFKQNHMEDPDVRDCVDSLRIVRKIHFYSYSNTWYLDVECVDNGIVNATKEDLEFLKREYGSDELKDVVNDYVGSEEIPTFFYFALGKVIKTDLK